MFQSCKHNQRTTEKFNKRLDGQVIIVTGANSGNYIKVLIHTFLTIFFDKMYIK